MRGSTYSWCICTLISIPSPTHPSCSRGLTGDNFFCRSFIFTLQEFARELVSLVDAMGRIYFIEQRRAKRGWRAWWDRRRDSLQDGPLNYRKKSSGTEKGKLKHHICKCAISSPISTRIFSPSLANVFIPQHHRHKAS